MIDKYVIKTYINSFSIIIFVIIFGFIIYLKPIGIYNANGSLRPFGIGYKNKTIIPMWLIVIILAFLSYFAILYTIYYLDK